jgi:predicted glycoside hydrolase/deacetylase ChbG (UPF0249 family)
MNASIKIRLILFIAACVVIITFLWPKFGETRLIVRGDDMGFCHEANLACIRAYQKGILTAVEVMVPCEAYPEAADLLKQNPGLDVGVHLTLNSEWENLKWGPLTNAPSLVDSNGHFLPMVWPNEAYGTDQALATSSPEISEIEQELQAQLERILHDLPNCSHASAHMAFYTIAPAVEHLTIGLIRKYRVDSNLRLFPIKSVDLFGETSTAEEMVEHAVHIIDNLTPGTYECVTHPCLLAQGKQSHWHIGAEDDARYRDATTRALVDDRLKEIIKKHRIRLIGYRDLKFWH